MTGLYKTRLYNILQGMKTRCNNPKDKHYKWYGAKGIKVCDEWAAADGAQVFIEWALSNGYADDLTIDRIDPDRDYAPDNCRWVTASANAIRANEKPSSTQAEQSIKAAVAYSGMSQANLAEAVGMTPQNFNQKMKRATFTEEELQQIAEALGASFVPFSFQFPDGMKI